MKGYINNSVNHFTRQGSGYEEYLNLVAVLPYFTSDILYQIVNSFRAYKSADPSQQPTYLVVNDLLMSGLCQTINSNYFMLRPEIKEAIESRGEEYKPVMAEFIRQYFSFKGIESYDKVSRNLRLWSKSILSPSDFESDIIAMLACGDTSNKYKQAYILEMYYKFLPKDYPHRIKLEACHNDDPDAFSELLSDSLRPFLSE